MYKDLYACPCCGYKTLQEKPPGTYDICPICYWEDDGEPLSMPQIIDGYEYKGAKDVSKISRMPILEMIKISQAINSPFSKILDMYGGMLEIKDSNYVFNSDDLIEFLTEDDIEEYLILTRRDSYIKVPNEGGKINELLNLSNEDAEKAIDGIRDRFANSVKEHLLK